MKKFLQKTLLLCLIVSVIVVLVNVWYVKSYRVNADYTDKFSEVPDHIQICNFGSSHGLYGYNYEEYAEQYQGFNFGLLSQYLSYDYRLFQNYESNIDQGAVVFITLSYVTLFGENEEAFSDFDSKNKRYYSILPPSLIKNYDMKNDFYVRYLPVLTVEPGVLVMTLLGKNRVDHTEEEWLRSTQEAEAGADAKTAYERHSKRFKFDSNGERIVNEAELEALYQLIAACKEKGVVPILVTTPLLQEYAEELNNSEGIYEEFYRIVDQVVAETGIEYYDYGFDERFSTHYEWFMDADHLNKEGAGRFTDIIMEEIINKKGLL